MKNVEKILTAMEKAFTGHKIEISYNFNAKIYCVFVDDDYVGNFEDRFCEQDFDNPDIELKVKAPLNSIKEFLEECEGSGGVGDVIRAVEWGYNKWREESQQNS